MKNQFEVPLLSKGWFLNCFVDFWTIYHFPHCIAVIERLMRNTFAYVPIFCLALTSKGVSNRNSWSADIFKGIFNNFIFKSCQYATFTVRKLYTRSSCGDIKFLQKQINTSRFYRFPRKDYIFFWSFEQHITFLTTSLL